MGKAYFKLKCISQRLSKSPFSQTSLPPPPQSLEVLLKWNGRKAGRAKKVKELELALSAQA